MTVVLVDDDINTLALLKRFTRKFLGIEAMAFEDSVAAANWLAKNQAQLVVIDYSMPILNGIDFIRQVRATALHEKTPIVMVTSSSFESLKSKAMLAGGSDFLTKPVSPSDFKARALDLIGKSAQTS